MTEEGKQVKIVYRDGDEIRVVRGNWVGWDNDFAVIERDRTRVWTAKSVITQIITYLDGHTYTDED